MLVILLLLRILVKILNKILLHVLSCRIPTRSWVRFLYCKTRCYKIFNIGCACSGTTFAVSLLLRLYFVITVGEKDTHKVLAYSKASGKPMIVHIPEGTGTAVLSLVHLDLEMRGEAAEAQGWAAAKLKEANMMRQDLLSAVLQYLGMKCSSVRLPELTPAYLFTSKMVRTCMHIILKYNVFVCLFVCVHACACACNVCGSRN